MPMMPIEPAKAVMSVRPFLVMRLLNERPSAVRNDIEVLRVGFAGRRSSSGPGSKGAESFVMWPSRSSTMRVAYWRASSGLCVTITTSRSRETSFKRSITCTDVTESRAPVGSSARRISGSLMRARAMATRCICPPESWAGRLSTWSARPTSASALRARSRRSDRETPESVSASSTFARMVWCGMRL